MPFIVLLLLIAFVYPVRGSVLLYDDDWGSLFVGLPPSALKFQDEDNWQLRQWKVEKAGMYVLCSWAAANWLYSGFSIQASEGSIKHFHQMNVMWNVVNSGLAAGGLYRVYRTDPLSLSLSESAVRSQRLQKILLFNAGLDVGYIATGLYLTERARRGGRHDEMLKGFGQSLIMQGAFLLVFDLALYAALARDNSTMLELISSLHISPGSIGLVRHF